MRNRDLPAGSTSNECGSFRDESGDLIPMDGLSKREAAAIAIRAGLEASPHGALLVTTPSGEERRMSRAAYAVQEADALFDELEKADAEG